MSRTQDAAVKDVVSQQTRGHGGVQKVIVKRRDFEQWAPELLEAVDRTRYDVTSNVEWSGKDGVVIAKKR